MQRDIAEGYAGMGSVRSLRNASARSAAHGQVASRCNTTRRLLRVIRPATYSSRYRTVAGGSHGEVAVEGEDGEPGEQSGS